MILEALETVFHLLYTPISDEASCLPVMDQTATVCESTLLAALYCLKHHTGLHRNAVHTTWRNHTLHDHLPHYEGCDGVQALLFHSSHASCNTGPGPSCGQRTALQRNVKRIIVSAPCPVRRASHAVKPQLTGCKAGHVFSCSYRGAFFYTSGMAGAEGASSSV